MVYVADAAETFGRGGGTRLLEQWWRTDGRRPQCRPVRIGRRGIVAEVLCRPDARTTPHRHPPQMRRRGFRETSVSGHGLCASGCRRPARPTSSMLGLGKTADNCIQIAYNGGVRPDPASRLRVSASSSAHARLPSRRWRRPGLKGSEDAADP